jgi:integrase
MRFQCTDNTGVNYGTKVTLLLAMLLDKIQSMTPKRLIPRKQKRQLGSVYERCDSFFVRYYTRVDGRSKQVSKLLCRRDAKHSTVDADSVLALRDRFMLDHVNANGAKPSHRVHSDDIGEFWTSVYEPFIVGSKKPSTVNGYRQIWRAHLRDHLTGKTFSEYKPHVGTAFLNTLARDHNRNTINHIRALLSGLFTHAVAVGVLDVNPVHSVKLLVKPKPMKKVGFYSLEEAEDIVSALVEHVDLQVVMVLSCFLGLRPGEIQGLEWGDIDGAAIHIRRSVWRGIVGTPKTEDAVGSLPLIDAVRVPLTLWFEKCGKPSKGYVFQTQGGGPVELKDWVQRRIKPILKAEGITWKGLYSGRRGAITAAIDLTGGNIAAGQELARHKDMTVTLRNYKQVTGVNLKAGLDAISSRLLKA